MCFYLFSFYIFFSFFLFFFSFLLLLLQNASSHLFITKRMKPFSTAGVSCGPSFRQPASASDVWSGPYLLLPLRQLLRGGGAPHRRPVQLRWHQRLRCSVSEERQERHAEEAQIASRNLPPLRSAHQRDRGRLRTCADTPSVHNTIAFRTKSSGQRYADTPECSKYHPSEQSPVVSAMQTHPSVQNTILPNKVQWSALFLLPGSSYLEPTPCFCPPF